MHRRLALLVVLGALAVAAPAHAAYVPIAGAPGYGPARYSTLHVDKLGPAKARTVLVLIPGMFAGSADFRIVAQALVDRVKSLQVWAMDRRPNDLEDTSYMVKALRGQISADEAFDYYLGWIGANPPVEHHYQPLKDAKFGFARGWGLRMAMEDTRRVVLAARRGGRTVVLGGHSLGGSSVYDYATWDFAGHPGYKDIAGMVAIDGGGIRNPAVTLKAARKQIADLRKSSPWLDLLGLNLPWAAGLFEETGALGALLDPDAPSIGQSFPLLPAEFKPSVPVTNRALLGYAFDERTSPPGLALIHLHSGHVNTADAEPHGWVDDSITPLDNLIALASHEPGNFVEWYYPRRLSIDVAAAGALRRTAATDYLGLRTWHTKQVDIPLYAFQTSLSKGQVLRGAQTFYKASQVPSAVFVDGTKGYAHLDPLTADPKRSDFVRTVVPFLRKLQP